MVKNGLAGSGKSYESVNYPGHYLRHCSFKMFIDNNARGNGKCDANDAVYKKDVSFNPIAANAVQLRSVNYTDRYVRHRSFKGELTPVSSELDTKDSTFIVREGLAGQGISFESVNYPGYFLRHQGFEIKLHKRENSDLFSKDSSFKELKGLAGKGLSYESVNYPGHYLRHCSFKMFIDNNAKDNQACDPKDSVYKGDVSFTPVSSR